MLDGFLNLMEAISIKKTGSHRMPKLMMKPIYKQSEFYKTYPKIGEKLYEDYEMRFKLGALLEFVFIISIVLIALFYLFLVKNVPLYLPVSIIALALIIPVPGTFMLTNMAMHCHSRWQNPRWLIDPEMFLLSMCFHWSKYARRVWMYFLLALANCVLLIGLMSHMMNGN